MDRLMVLILLNHFHSWNEHSSLFSIVNIISQRAPYQLPTQFIFIQVSSVNRREAEESPELWLTAFLQLMRP